MSDQTTDSVSTHRYNHIRKVLERPGPFVHPDFRATADNLKLVQLCRVLIVGAGGLGCELVKTLALMGFRNIHLLDMDTIDISNLNRQFLFRMTDIGKSKAEVAAAFINKKVQGTNVVPHFCKLEDKDNAFYRDFHIVVSGLDSKDARLELNRKITSLVRYSNQDVVPDSIIPIVDGGTEGFKGSARVIIPTITPCFECNVDLYPPQVTYPACTIANNPRLPEHCIEYVRSKLWLEEKPFKAAVFDADNLDHIKWIQDNAVKRAEKYNITGVTLQLTQGVVKNIIPAVASTNAIIAAACATEVFKLATSSANAMDNYMIFSNLDGIHSFTYPAQKKVGCVACSRRGYKTLNFKKDVTLYQLIEVLKSKKGQHLKGPSVFATVDEKNKTLFMAGNNKEPQLNLKENMSKLGVRSGDEIMVADETSTHVISYLIYYPQ